MRIPIVITALLSITLGQIGFAEPVQPAKKPLAEGSLEARLRQEESHLRPARKALRPHFAAAYKAYPSIPRGTLEAIAFVQTRWEHVIPPPRDAEDNHHHMPQGYGIMGLYDGGNAEDQIAQAAALTGMPVARIKHNPRANIFAAAALLDAELRKDVERLGTLRGGMIVAPELEDITPALRRYAGFAPAGSEQNPAQAYARTSFAYDVLLAQDRGVDDRGIQVPEKPVAWERAFSVDQLTTLRAPFVRLKVTEDVLKTREYHLDPITETLQRVPGVSAGQKESADESATVPSLDIPSLIDGAETADQAAQSSIGTDVQIQSTDYGPALWVPSPYYHNRSSYGSVTIHTAQGSYAGTINWFQNNPYSVSAHYVVRSSDGQITQMVRNSKAAHHVGVHNNTTIGIEHEGYVSNSSWYTSAMYNSSANLVRNLCASYSAINCANAYSGPAHSSVVVLSTSIDVKGHQHYSSQTHTDPGINWNWGNYYNLLNPGAGGTTKVLDGFESSEGHFNTSPTYSGSTQGISTQSTATRDCNVRHNGNCSLRVKLRDNTATNSDWQVRLLSGAGSPSANVQLSRSNGRVGYWVYAAASGMKVSIGIDDSDGTERGDLKSLAANTWTFVEWDLTKASDWNAWVGGADGNIDASTVTLDAIWIFRDPDTAYEVNVYIDRVKVTN